MVRGVLSSAQIVARSVERRRLMGAPAGASAATIVQGEGWRIVDIVCCADEHDAPFEERHEYVSIALVVAGAFSYRAGAGAADLQAGSTLLGGANVCFTCGHEHGAGDRCIAFQFSVDRFEELLSLLGGRSAQMSFPRIALPASEASAALCAEAEALAAGRLSSEAHDFAVRVVSSAMASLDRRGRDQGAAPAQARAMLAIARMIEEEPGAGASVKALAAVAGMSPFHFIRCFKRATGMTPHAFVRAMRVREAVRLLRDPSLSIAAIAFEAGFEDLSVFNRAFRQICGVAPRTMRARMAL